MLIICLLVVHACLSHIMMLQHSYGVVLLNCVAILLNSNMQPNNEQQYVKTSPIFLIQNYSKLAAAFFPFSC